MKPIKVVVKITIENGGKIIFETDGRDTLAPLDRDERSRVFYALTEALATIAGVMPLLSFHATEVVTDERCSSSSQYRPDPKSENIVRLEVRRGNQASVAKTD